MIVGLCGFGCTGASAVLDYLRDYDSIEINEEVELSFIYDPDGFMDLENAICLRPVRYYSGDAAIKKFRHIMFSYELVHYMKRVMPIPVYKKLVSDYINGISKIRWNGFWHFDKRHYSDFHYWIKYVLGWKYLRVFDKLGLKIPKSFPNNSIMTIPVSKDVFYNETRTFLSNLLRSMGLNGEKTVIVDQPFPANCPSSVFHFFEDNCKAIVVVKDPRDMYFFVKDHARLDVNWIPCGSCMEFIEFYKHQMSICHFDERTLVVNFEDLIYEYESTTAKICNFIGIEKLSEKGTYFHPERSIGNTQIYKKHKECKEEIELIERELKEYLYPFEKYNVGEIKAKPFVF